MPVVYIIKNIINGSLYIGSALNAKARKARHFKDLRNNKHHSRYLQRAYNKYGKDNFVFSVIEDKIDKNSLLEREQYWMNNLKPQYNISKVAGNTLGVKHTKEVRQKNKIRNTGFKNGNAKIKESDIPNILSKSETHTNKEIAKELNVSSCTIERLFKKLKVKKPKVYTAIRIKQLSDLAKNRRNGAKPVLQYDLKRNFINSFPSANEAAKQTGIGVATISQCCNNIIKKPRRFYFTFK